MSLVQCDQKHFVANTDNGFVVGLKCITSFFIKTFMDLINSFIGKLFFERLAVKFASGC